MTAVYVITAQSTPPGISKVQTFPKPLERARIGQACRCGGSVNAYLDYRTALEECERLNALYKDWTFALVAYSPATGGNE